MAVEYIIYIKVLLIFFKKFFNIALIKYIKVILKALLFFISKFFKLL